MALFRKKQDAASEPAGEQEFMAESYEAFKIAEHVGDQALDLFEGEDPPEHVKMMVAGGYPLVCQVAPSEANQDVWQLMTAVSQLGYFTRMAETRWLTEKAHPTPAELTELLQTAFENSEPETTGEALMDCAARFARAEPWPNATEADGSLSAVVPGQSPNARLDSAYHTLGPILTPTEKGSFTETEAIADDPKNPIVVKNGGEVIDIWLYGFILRVFEEHYVEAMEEAAG